MILLFFASKNTSNFVLWKFYNFKISQASNVNLVNLKKMQMQSGEVCSKIEAQENKRTVDTMFNFMGRKYNSSKSELITTWIILHCLEPINRINR